jgi:hypothetical protein
MLRPKRFLWLFFGFFSIMNLFVCYLVVWQSHLSPLTLLILSLGTIGVCALGTFLGWLALRAIFPDYWKFKSKQSAQGSEESNQEKQARVIYKLTGEDIVASQPYISGESSITGHQRKLARLSLIVASLIGLAVASLILVFFPEYNLLAIALFVISALLFLWAIFYYMIVRKVFRNSVVRNNAWGMNKLTGKHNLSITPDNVTCINNLIESTNPWSDVEWIKSTDKYLFIKVHGLGPYIVPKRAFTNEEEFKLFIDTARTYYESAKAGNDN